MKKLAIFFLSVLLLVPTGARACWDDDWDDWEDTGSWDDDDWYDDSWYDDDWYDDGDDIAWDETLDGETSTLMIIMMTTTLHGMKLWME